MQKKIFIDSKLLSVFSHFLKYQFGLYFPKEKYNDLERELNKIMLMMHESDPYACVQKLTALPLNKEQLEILTSHLTIGETYFFREPEYFQTLKNILQMEFIIPRLNNGQWLRIWSAGCATGEEAYSIAITVSDLIPSLKEWNILILATDINLHALEKIKQGIYSEWSFRNVSQEIKEKYFNQINKNAYEIKSPYKKMIEISYLNLIRDSYPSLVNNTNAMDIIFCRNLLIYFDVETAQNILKKLSKSLAPGGYLVVSSSEHSLVPKSLYHGRKINNSIFYQRNEDAKKNDVSFYNEYDTELNNIYINNFLTEKNILDDVKTWEVNEVERINMDNLENIEKNDENETASKKEIANKIPFETTEQQIPEHPKNNKSLQAEIIAKELANSGKLKEALLVIEEGIKDDKCNVILHYLKSIVLRELNLLDEAIAELNIITYLDPNFVLAYFALGNIAIAQDRKQAARKYYSIVLSLTKLLAENDVLPGSEGYLTAGSMRDIIHSKKLIH